MTTLSQGDAAPDFTMTSNGGATVSLADFAGSWLVLYFYPKDDTPGCTKQAIAFTEHQQDFASLGVKILGVSKDTVAKHEKFAAKHELTIQLGSDPEGAACESFGVWVEKKNYGRTYMGIERTTFLIDPEGIISQIWPKVRVAGHVEKVLETVRSQIN